MVALGTAVPVHCEDETLLSYGPPCDSKSKRQAGNANANVAGLMTILVQSVEHHHQVQFTEGHKLLPKTARRIGWLIIRVIIRSNDMTEFRRLRATEQKGGSVAGMCETVLYKKQGLIGYTPWGTARTFSAFQHNSNSIGWTQCSKPVSTSLQNLVLVQRSWIDRVQDHS